METNEIIEILNRPISQELLARDIVRLAYVATDGTPRNVPIAAEQRVEWEEEVRSLYKGMVRIVVTPTWAKLIDFETTLPSVPAAGLRNGYAAVRLRADPEVAPAREVCSMFRKS